VPRVADQMLPLIELATPLVVALDCSAVFDIEYTAIKMLIEAEMKMRDQGIALWLVALNPDALDVVQRSKLGETLERERIVSSLETAVQQFQQLEIPDRRPA
jgi:MFS superfamily sulfate permease-like transporter